MTLPPSRLPPSTVRPWETLGERTLASARVFELTERRVRAPHTGDEHDFYVLTTGDWCNVVAVTDDAHLVCVRQYRHGVGRVTLELPGGILDPGEDIVAGALRELLEETGVSAAEGVRIGAVDSNPAILTNRTHTVVALGLTAGGATAFDATEDLEVVLVPFADVPRLTLDGHFSHALAVAALYLYEAWRRPGAPGTARSDTTSDAPV